jgi:uncharacterized protein YigE (DUF2233 family)
MKIMKIPYIIGLVLVLMGENVFAIEPKNEKWFFLTNGIDYRVIKRSYSEQATVRKIKLHVLRIKQGVFEVLVHSFHNLENHQQESIKEFRNRNKYLITLSGGFFYPDFRHPVGLVIENGKELFSLSNNLSGVVWIKENQLYLSQTNQFRLMTVNADHAIQGYPRIVDPINKMGIYRQNHKYAHRAAICTIKDYFILMISDKSFAGLSLYELASIAQANESDDGLACDIAVNLDGGPAPGISIDPKLLNLEISEDWQVPNVIAIGKKKRLPSFE